MGVGHGHGQTEGLIGPLTNMVVKILLGLVDDFLVKVQLVGADHGAGLPPKPPRPVSPRQQAENTLKEAFPSLEASVVKAVLVASNWNVERAFHALLGK